MGDPSRDSSKQVEQVVDYQRVSGVRRGSQCGDDPVFKSTLVENGIKLHEHVKAGLILEGRMNVKCVESELAGT
jgi:hypothetical protein